MSSSPVWIDSSVTVPFTPSRGQPVSLHRQSTRRHMHHRSARPARHRHSPGHVSASELVRNYDVFQNNCEDFALYCKMGLLTVDRLGVGRSGQASSVIWASLAALSSPLKFMMPRPVGVAKVTAGMYCLSRYATNSGVRMDIGVRTDVVKVAVEDLARNLKWAVENQIGQKKLVIADCDEKQTVYIFGCKNSVHQIQGKVNNITVDKCTKMGVVFKDVVAACEIVNSNSVEVQCQLIAWKDGDIKNTLLST